MSSDSTALATVAAAQLDRRPQEQREQASALQAQARAEVEASYLMAWQRPRDEDGARDRLLHACKRPAFAALVEYSRPVGGGKPARGPTIRFAEAAKRAWGNLKSGAVLLNDSPTLRTYRCSATDLESNTVEFLDVAIEKTVERRVVPEGITPISKRKNSRGQWVHTIPADELSLLAKERAACRKAVRQCIIALLPEDIVLEALSAARTTVREADAADPDAAKKRLLDAFSSAGIKPADLRDFVGHSLERVSPKELEELRGMYGALSEGHVTFDEALEQKRIERGEIKPSKSAAEKVRKAIKNDMA